ncbi:hypothetical protein B0H13DRAFT_2315183 [Mycena leptocephala]|nr:hypothetical protein B0H13DRAFT_2315183 [Mycena leptocephala]
MQWHLIAQLANILAALRGAGVECLCSSSTATSSALGMGMSALPVVLAAAMMVAASGAREYGHPLEHEHEQGRAMLCPPPSPPSPLLHPHLHLPPSPHPFHIHLDNDNDTEAEVSRGPEAHVRWGPLISVTRGMRAVEWVWASGGCGGVMLEREQEGAVYGSEREEGIRAGCIRVMRGRGRDASASTAYGVIERTSGWDVVHEGRVQGWETEEDGDGDVDVVGDGNGDIDKPTWGKTRRHDREWERDKRRDREREHAQVEGICPPKMHKRWRLTEHQHCAPQSHVAAFRHWGHIQRTFPWVRRALLEAWGQGLPPLLLLMMYTLAL